MILLFKIRDASGERNYLLITESNLTELTFSKDVIVNCKYLIIHSPQGFSGIIYNTGWGTLPDCLRCSLQVVKE